jgi:putative transposase
VAATSPGCLPHRSGLDRHRDFTTLGTKLDIRQSMGRVGSCFDNAAAESFFSTLEHEVLSRYHFSTREEAREVVVKWLVDFYNGKRRHSSCGMLSLIDYENAANLEAA